MGAVDWIGDAQRFEVIYHLQSLDHNLWLNLSCKVREGQPCKSLTWVWQSAEYHEREQWEFLGIPFEYHPDLRKNMLDYTIEGFPFRKDYPVTGYTEMAWSQEAHTMIVQSPPQIDTEWRDYQELDSDWEMSFNEKHNPLDNVSHLLFPSHDMDTPEMAALKSDAWSTASAGIFDNMGFVDSLAVEHFQAPIDVPLEDPDEHHPRINDMADY